MPPAAAVVGLDNHTLHSGAGILLVLGTALSTYVAHVVAHLVGHQIETEAGATDAQRRDGVTHLMRDAQPILSAGSIPALFLAAGHWGWIPVLTAAWLASGLIVVRIAFTGVLVIRYTGQNRPWKALFAGLGLALVAGLVVALKLVLTH